MVLKPRTLSARWFPRLAVVGITLLAAGCFPDRVRSLQADKFGRTYYIDGAGNWGFGVADIQAGLRRAGYEGRIINYRWSPTLNPALDQTVGRIAAHLRGKELGQEITNYLTEYPANDVNIISLSAGTGVAVWACESIEPPTAVHNVILLGSSLSSNYDMTKALAHVRGKVYVYSSAADLILQGPVRTLGTIDGKIGATAAGIVGLHPKGGSRDKIVNIPWSPKYERYGWTGAHTDATSEPFVRTVLAQHILPTTAVEIPDFFSLAVSVDDSRLPGRP